MLEVLSGKESVKFEISLDVKTITYFGIAVFLAVLMAVFVSHFLNKLA